ncbi:MAG: hypothetical protein ACQEV7_18080 [Bacillota bacterium]
MTAITHKRNIRIFGEGTSTGGIYHKVSIHGQGRIRGNLQCDTIKIFGDFNMNGKATVDTFKLFGNSKVYDEIKGNNFKIFGNLELIKKMTGDACLVRGWLSSKESVELDTLSVKGGLDIEGLLNVGKLTVTLGHSTSRIREIGGDTIRIKGKWLNFFGGQNRLMVESIEGNNIYLEHTTAKVVRGNNVSLGPDCNIELVEYQTSYKSHKTANAHKVNQH